MKVYKRKHHRGQKHYSGKELLEYRKAEREEHEKQLKEQKEEDYLGFPIRYYPASLLYDYKISVF